MASFGDVIAIAVPAGAFIAYLTDCLGMCPGLRDKINTALTGALHPQSSATYYPQRPTIDGAMGFPIDQVFQPIPRISSKNNLRSKDFVNI